MAQLGPTSRRTLFIAAAASVAAGPAANAFAAPGNASQGSRRTRDAVDFIQEMTTRSQDPAGPRLPRSYTDEAGLFSTGFVYDCALAACAAIAGGRVKLAQTIGDGLIFAMDHDPEYDDGRLRQAYNVSPYVFHDGVPNPDGLRRANGYANIGWQFGFLGTAVGDMAWPGIALAQLHDATGEARYLEAAVRIGHWIIDRATNEGSLGGFSFGVTAADEKVPNVSTEHNVDCVAFFRMLEALDPEGPWAEAQHRAEAFLEYMWEPDGGYFYTGSNDGDTINRYPLPLDPQTWGWLATRDERFAPMLDWAEVTLSATDVFTQPHSQLPEGVQISGVTFSSASLTSTGVFNDRQVNPLGVWLEGTAQLAAALDDRGEPGDRARAVAHLQEIEKSRRVVGQDQHVDGELIMGGVVAATSTIDTGFGFAYFQVQHTGASAWTVMASRRTNPMQLGEL